MRKQPRILEYDADAAQAPEVAAIHIAIYKIGAIALPLAMLFGADALAYRLENSGAKAIITNAPGLAKLEGIETPGVGVVLSIDGATEKALGFHETLARASSDFAAVTTRADDPAMMIYTSGTTGQPKGALHAHRVLIGHMPGIDLPHDFFPQPGDRFWTPADWAWAGGLLDCLLPSLYCGVPVVARRFDKFDPEEAFAVMARHGVRNAFIPPTALRMLRAVPNPRGRHDIRLRSVGSGGEALEILDSTERDIANRLSDGRLDVAITILRTLLFKVSATYRLVPSLVMSPG